MDILIADDDFFVRSLLQNMLKHAGHRVIAAENGVQAWELLQEHECKMVLTDWMMPDMDGLELCRTIRRHQTEAGYVFIVILTSNDSKESIITGLEAGADDYLCKPFDRAELIARLKTGIRIIDLEQSLRKANEEIRLLSITDPLTGSYNKRYLQERLPPEITRSRRYGHPLSLILCDLDRFKQVNDTYGHPAGDRVLKTFVERLKPIMRQDLDWIARYGGEEFAIVLPETALAEACEIAERFRLCLEEKEVALKETSIQVTASFGVSGCDGKASDESLSADALLRGADRFLYQAKEGGRNQVRSGAYV